MPYLRSLLGVLLVMIALASASQLSASQILGLDANATSQSDDSDDQPSDQVAAVDDFLLHKRFILLMLAASENPSAVTGFRPEKPALTTFSRVAPFLIPTRLFISQSGLLPRAPSVA